MYVYNAKGKLERLKASIETFEEKEDEVENFLVNSGRIDVLRAVDNDAFILNFIF